MINSNYKSNFMKEIKNDKLINNIDKIYYNLIRNKDKYIIEGNFDYLKKIIYCVFLFLEVMIISKTSTEVFLNL